MPSKREGMTMKPRILSILALALCPGLLVANSINPRPDDLVFVYIHGFGGEKKSPAFCENMESFIKEKGLACRVENYLWDSVKVAVLKAGASWRESEKRADQEAKKFKTEVIDRLEKGNTPYVLVGYSVGSRVVLRALEASGGNLKQLKGVYFLGSAMTKDTTLAKDVLPSGMKIINYHSPLKDSVHQLAFSFMNTEDAGGRVGFDDAKVFDNYRVSCSHAHKGVGVHIDYSQMAGAIGYVALFKEGVQIQGKTSLNLKSQVGQGDVWWNKVLRWPCKIDGAIQEVEIEQNSLNANYYRALVESPDGKRRRVARGSNVHAILRKLNAVPPKDPKSSSGK